MFIKIVNKYYQKHKETLQKKHVKDTKIVLKKRKKKGKKKVGDRYKNLPEEEKKNYVRIWKNIV